MAAITPTEICSKTGKVIGYSWSPVTDTTAGVDTCTPVRFEEDIDDLCLSIHGTMGAGASVALRIDNGNKGTLDTNGLLVDYVTAKDIVAGTAISLTADNTGSQIVETGRYYQPVVTGDTNNTTSIRITLVGK